MIWQSFFEGKRVVLMGLGLLGRGVEDAVFLAKYAGHLHVTDLKSKEELETSLKKLAGFENISFALGGHRLEDFRDADMVIKSAGVPLDSPYIAEAQKADVPVLMSAALFSKFFLEGLEEDGLISGRLVGVTGTKGKSTVSHLIRHILEENLGKEQRVRLGGNAYPGSTLAFLEDMEKSDLVVLELDSWQLQGFGDLRISPEVAVFTSFFPDHLNYYGGSMERYFEDKANIFKYQPLPESSGRKACLIADESSFSWIKKYYPERSIFELLPADEAAVRSWNLPLPGEHNIENVLLSVALVVAGFGLEVSGLRPSVESFKGVPGRLELIREVGGVKFYNDTTATNPTSVGASLRALSSNKNIVLIAGGADKGLESGELVEEILLHSKKVILLPGTGTDRLNLGEDSLKARSMEEAVKLATEASRPGDIVLLSPGFASFGLFVNEFDRGDQFVKVVKDL